MTFGYRPQMIDHISVGVTDLTKAAGFYDAVLEPLGYVRLFTKTRGIGYGKHGAKDEGFAILAAGPEAKVPGSGFHFALSAPSRAAVDAFHAAGLGAGGIDEGGPGLRLDYGDGYYAAFLRDLDGHRLEAVFHEQASASFVRS